MLPLLAKEVATLTALGLVVAAIATWADIAYVLVTGG
jgi:hypothetical protein